MTHDGKASTTNPNAVIADLIALATAIHFALDDSEEIADGKHLIEADHIEKLLAVIDRLDALPDDKPGYTMDFPDKAQWALRDLTPFEVKVPADDPVTMWAEIHKLRAELSPPDGFGSWKDAAISERMRAESLAAQLAEAQERIAAYEQRLKSPHWTFAPVAREPDNEPDDY